MEWDGKGMCNNYKKSLYIVGTQYERHYRKYELRLQPITQKIQDIPRDHKLGK